MRRTLGLGGLLAVAPAVAVGLLLLTGGLIPDVEGLPSPGVVTTVGLPASQALRDVATLIAVGGLVLAVTCVPPHDQGQRRQLGGARRRLVDLAGQAGFAWAGLSLVLAVLTFSDAAAEPLTSPGFAERAQFFVAQYDVGRYLLTSALLATAVGLVATTTRSVRVAGIAGALALAGLWPMALSAHGAGALRHDVAVDVQAVHWAGVAVWAGGLIGVVVVRRRLGDALVPTMRRYSVLAGVCFGLVAVAGLAAAALRLDGPGSLLSSYGALLAVKVAAAVLLGGFGLWQRRRLLPGLEHGRSGAFRSIVLLETVVMVAAAGVAVALNRTPPPGADPAPSLAADLLGYPPPGPLGAAEWFTTWHLDSFWLPVASVAVVLYVAGVVRLRRRGDRWSVPRLVAWCAGWALFVWATSGAPGTYGRVLFSMHMVQHMTIATTVPVLLVVSAPVTLALRALRRREDGSMGPREWVLAIVHSPVTAFLGQPLVASANFIVSLVVFYNSSLFDLALETHTGHVLMTAHFLLAGYFFAGCLVGSDPGLRQPPYPMRVLMLMVTFGMHAFFSISLMASSRILAEDWFASLRPPWADSLADDQYLGASLGWALGDYPLALLAGVLVYRWVRADRRESDRFDRQEDRDGGSQLAAYNAYLAQIARAPAGSAEPAATERQEESASGQGER